MSNYMKVKFIQNISEVFPPFSTSIANLVQYISNEEKIEVSLLSQLVEITDQSHRISNILTEDIMQLNKKVNEIEKKKMMGNSKDSIKEDIKNVKEMIYITGNCNYAISNITDGISTLIYIIAEENDILDYIQAEKEYGDFLNQYKNRTIEDAINDLFIGAKKISEIIEDVID